MLFPIFFSNREKNKANNTRIAHLKWIKPEESGNDLLTFAIYSRNFASDKIHKFGNKMKQNANVNVVTGDW